MNPTLPGDRGERSDFRWTYPDNAFWHNHDPDSDLPRGGVLDIQAVFGAKGDGVTDDTQAFVEAYNFLMDPRRAAPNREKFIPSKVTHIIYLPAGVYRVSDTIIYAGEPVTRRDGQGAEYAIRFVGAGRTRTTIKLDDGAPGFGDPKNPKPVVSYGKSRLNNEIASNFLRHLTVDAGDNRGAIGVLFDGANVAGVSNVTIRGNGVCGLSLDIGIAQGYHKDITIEGFDYGIGLSNDRVSHPTFEYVTLRDQTKAGFTMGCTSTSIRKLLSVNTVPAIAFADACGQLVILDSEFREGSPAHVALDFPHGHLFARDITASGYQSILAQRPGIAPPPANPSHVEEYVSDPGWPQGLFSEHPETVPRLPVLDGPGIEYLEPCDEAPTWVSVNQFGAKPCPPTQNQDDYIPTERHEAFSLAHDAADGIRAAADSGASTIYFLPGMYVINQTIPIPSSVKRINFMFANLKRGAALGPDAPAFRILGEREDDPLILEDLFQTFLWESPSRLERDPGGSHVWFEHASLRTVVLRYMLSIRSVAYKNTVSGGKVFIDNGVGGPSCTTGDHAICYQFHGQDVWARDLDPEHESSGHVLNDSSRTWVLGYKIEVRDAPGMINRHGGVLEVLGGMHNAWQEGSTGAPAFINEDACATLVFRKTGTYVNELLIQDIRDGETRELRADEALAGNNDWPLVPLYRSGR